MAEIIDYIRTNWQVWVVTLIANSGVILPIILLVLKNIISKKDKLLAESQNSALQSMIAMLELMCEQMQLLFETQNAIVDTYGSATLKQRYKDTLARINNVYTSYVKLRDALKEPVTEIATKIKQVTALANEVLNNADTNQIVVR